MKHPAGRLLVYESLYALNRDFEQVLAHLARLQELGVFQHRDFGNAFPAIIQETRAWANMELVEALQPLEQDDLNHFSRLRSDVLTEDERWQKKERKKRKKRKERKKRKKAAGKKRRQKRDEAKSEGV